MLGLRMGLFPETGGHVDGAGPPGGGPGLRAAILFADGYGRRAAILFATRLGRSWWMHSCLGRVPCWGLL